MRSAARLALLCALLVACPGAGLDDVRRAATPAEERAAFAALARGGVQFTAHAADGTQLDLGAPRWWDRARTLRLGVRGSRETLEHTLLDPENALVLMQE